VESVQVIGAGGIGCALAHALSGAGVQVTLVDADGGKVERGRSGGVAVGGDHRPAAFVHFDEWRPPADALLLLCTKCYDNTTVLARVPVGAALVPVQNGFDGGLHARVKAEGIASFVSECHRGEPHTRITRGGRLHLGPVGPSAEGLELARRLAGWLRHSPFRIEVVADVRPYKYTKLMYNAAISPLAACAGLDNGELLRWPRLRRLFFALLRENYAILLGAGVPLGKVGPFHPSRVAAILRRPLVAGALAWAFYPGLRGTYCSMSGDLPRGRTEIDYYNGHLLELAGPTPCPLNRRVYELVKRMERDGTAPHPAVLEELFGKPMTVAGGGRRDLSPKR
jgi:2-dehydropantoate 2-reductase